MAVIDDRLTAEVVVGSRQAFVRSTLTEVDERDGWLRITTPSLKEGGLNEVVWSRLGGAEADSVIDATVADYRRLGCRFRWNVGPDSAPGDLAARLRARGLTGHPTLGMARTIDQAWAEGAFVERVTHASLEAYTATMAEGWAVSPDGLREINARTFASPRHQLFLARVDGEPAATASAVYFERSVYLLGGVVLPRFRRRGLYTAMVAARVNEALARGLDVATSRAIANTSAPLLKKLGFHEVAQFEVFVG